MARKSKPKGKARPFGDSPAEASLPPRQSGRSPKREEAIQQARHIEDGMLTLQGVLGSYIAQIQDLRRKLEGTDGAGEQEEERKP